MFGHKIKLDDDLYGRLAKAADIAGYASADEFIMHILETAAGPEGEDSEEAIRQRLKGLGYIE